jgi:hypothetical protein
MQHSDTITADAPKTHLTAAEAIALLAAHRCDVKRYSNGTIAAQTIRNGRLDSHLFIDRDGLYRAAPILLWLGL